jgi:hypothetical protein
MHEQDVPGAVTDIVDSLKAPAQESNSNAQVPNRRQLPRLCLGEQ